MIYNFDDLRNHIGHKIGCVRYGQGDEVLNVALECEDCNVVLVDLNDGDLLSKELAEDIGKTIYHSWHIDDVISQARSRDINLSEQQAIEILQRVDHHKDSMIGISWDTLDVHTDQYLKDMSGG